MFPFRRRAGVCLTVVSNSSSGSWDIISSLL